MVEMRPLIGKGQSKQGLVTTGTGAMDREDDTAVVGNEYEFRNSKQVNKSIGR